MIKNSKKGQSVLEMVFAIWILLMVVSAVLALATTNIFGQKESEAQIIANNLAREGIEVVRNIRDSNWLSGRQWDLGLSGLVNNNAIVDYNGFELDFNYTDDSLFISGDGVYSHQTVNGSFSGFKRHLVIEAICQNTDCPGNNCGREEFKSVCGANEQKIGLKVTAIVSWQQRSKTRQVKLEDLLYEWK